MTTETIARRTKKIERHFNEALATQLKDDEIIEGVASQGHMYLPLGYALFRLVGLAPKAYLVITNKRVLIVEIRGTVPAKENREVRPATIVEQRPRGHDETFNLPTSSRALGEPKHSPGINNIRVADFVFHPSMSWKF